MYAHIAGIDLVQAKDGRWLVLEDNRYYGDLLREMMDFINGGRGINVILTPGCYNSTFFEHSYLAEKTGAVLAFPGDLVVAPTDAMVFFLRNRSVCFQNTLLCRLIAL